MYLLNYQTTCDLVIFMEILNYLLYIWIEYVGHIPSPNLHTPPERKRRVILYFVKCYALAYE